MVTNYGSGVGIFFFTRGESDDECHVCGHIALTAIAGIDNGSHFLTFSKSNPEDEITLLAHGDGIVFGYYKDDSNAVSAHINHDFIVVFPPYANCKTMFNHKFQLVL